MKNCCSIILSSAGLQNIVPNSSIEQDDFSFIFGEKEINMTSIFAEFISPAVSRLHQIDPTLNKLYFNEIFCSQNQQISNYLQDIFSNDIISLIKQISKGQTIEINKDQGFKLQIISVFLDNEELFMKINEHYPSDINESNIDDYLHYLDLFSKNSIRHFNFNEIIDFISSHFFSIDKKKLIKLPKTVIYSIITNDHFKIEDEDSLLDFINELFSNENDQNKNSIENDQNITTFYELIEFTQLSKEKFYEFIESIENDQITNQLWIKLKNCFYINFEKKQTKPDRSAFNFDGDPNHSFCGIINYLTEKSGGNVSLNGTVDVTALNPQPGYGPENVVDFSKNKEKYFQASKSQNLWLKYDFKNLKVRPSHYSIMSRPDGYQGFYNPTTWVIEGSNTNRDDDWKILDSRYNITSLDGKSLFSTFKISNELESNEFYRYLRFRLTGVNSGGDRDLRMSSLEFFGMIK